MALFCAFSALSVEKPAHRQLGDFDKRFAPEGVAELPPPRQEAAARLRTRVRGLRVDLDQRTKAPKFIASPGGFLTGPEGQGRAVPQRQTAPAQPLQPQKTIKAFVDEYADLFGHDSRLLDRGRVRRDYTDRKTGVRSITWQQELDGIHVYEGVCVGHVTAVGELVTLGSQFVANPEAAAANGTPNRAALQALPAIHHARAVVIAAESLEEHVLEENVHSLADSAGPEQRAKFRVDGLPNEAVVRLVWLPLNENSLRLCWQVELSRPLGGERFRVVIDAATGEVLLRRQLTVYLTDASFRVFAADSPSPLTPGHAVPLTNQPPVMERSLVTLSALVTNASPVGWIHDGENETRGNNVDAHLDHNADDLPDLPRPTGNPFRVFDFPVDLTQAPFTYGEAAVVNLFYWCNWMHDKLYELGFTEAAGNFQKDNFGRGGLGNDPIIANAQDGSGVNNANFTPSADGEPGRIQMFVFTGPDPDRDGDFDAEIIIHEYVHGLSDRLVGGGVGISALQTGGMGEGWSDFYAEALLSEPSDDLDGTYPMGGYASHRFFGLDQNYYYGIRRYPYTTDMSKNPLTFRDIDPDQAQPHFETPMSPLHLPFNPNFANQVHNAGEVWCVTLWELRANLIRKHGYFAGNHLALQLVTDGMKLSPPNPNFLQARDAIILADQVLTGGANWGELWAAFAKRGMGFSATSPASSTTFGLREAFDLPDPLVVSPMTAAIANGAPGGPFEPSCFAYILTNYATTSLRWSAQSDAPWLSLTPSAGTLAPGQGATVTVCINDAARAMDVGSYPATITFSNLTTGIAQTRETQVRLSQVASMPFREDFESGELGPYWLYTGTFDHRAEITSAHNPHGGDYHLVVDSSTGEFSRNEVTLTLDVAGYTNVVLEFWARGFGEEPDGPAPVPILNGADFDGVAISSDGVRWYEVQSLERISNTYGRYVVHLDEAVATHGLRYHSQFRIRLNQFDNNPLPFDGIAFDDISVTGVPSRRFRILSSAGATEGDGTLTGAGQVVLFMPAEEDVRIQLTGSNSNKVSLPPLVVVPRGSTQAVFNINIADNALVDGSQLVTITGSAPGFTGEPARILVHDNESNRLRVELPRSATEGDGRLRKKGSVHSNTRVARDTLVELTSSDTLEVTVPPSVVIPAGRSSAEFEVVIVDDTRLDGLARPTVTARVRHWTAGIGVIEVRDNDQLGLQVFLPAEINEGEGTVAGGGRVQLAATLRSNLVVTLFSSDETELTVPRNVTIPAGSFQAVFPLTVLDDAQIDGAQLVTVRALAVRFPAPPDRRRDSDDDDDDDDGRSGNASEHTSRATARVKVLDDETAPAAYEPRPPHGATNVNLDVDLAWRGGSGEAVVNGGFETGDFTGWRILNSGYGTFFVNDGKFDPEGPDGPLPPLDGRFNAMTEQIGSGQHVLYQDVFIPREAKSALWTWSDRIRNHATQFVHPTHEYRVELRDLTNGVLAVAFTTRPGDPFLQDWKQRSFDLTAYRGRTVRLAFVEEDTLGYFNVHIDNVSVVLGAAAPTTFDVYFGQKPVPGPAQFLGNTANTFWELPPLALGQTYYWQVVSRRGAALTPGPVWKFTTRGVGAIDRFEWAPIGPEQFLDQPFPVTLTARDDLGNVATNFTGTARLEGLRGSSTSSAVLVTEVDTGINDAVEFMNVTTRRLDISGWQITLYEGRIWPTPRTTFTVPTNTLCLPGEVFKLTVFGEAPGRYPNFIAGTNINWSQSAVSNQLAVLVRDAAGGVVDFMCAVEANPSRIGTPIAIPPGEWSGLAVAVSTNSALTYQRVGGMDRNRATDWVVTNASMGELNFEMQIQFTNPAPVALSPTIASNFVAGIWRGHITVHEGLSNLVLLADDERSHIGLSTRFNVSVSNDLAVTLSDSPDLVTIGDDLTYTIRVSNSGPGAAADVVVTNRLPEQVAFVSASGSRGACTNSDGLVTCGLGTLAAGETAEIRIVASAVVPGPAINVVGVSRGSAEAYLANNGARADSTIVLPRLITGLVSISEGNSGIREARLGVSLSEPCRLPVSVDFATTNNTATAGQDYIATNGTLHFAPGTTEQSFGVAVIGDTIYESLETVFVLLSNPTNASLGSLIGRVRINEDDPMPFLTVDDLSVTEPDPGALAQAVFKLRLSAPSGLATSISYTTSNRTAAAGVDYVRQSGALTIEPGVTNATIVVGVHGDSRLESNEVFQVSVTNLLNALPFKNFGLCTIVDNGRTELERFSWSTVPSPQRAQEPFSVTVTARDGRNEVVSGFTGTVALRGVISSEERTVGTGSNRWEFPLATFYHDARTQVIYPAAQVGAAGQIHGVALQVAAPPAQALSNWTIRLRHTPLTNYARPEWEQSNWTTVFARDAIVSENGWAAFYFDAPFGYNGRDSLMVDYSFNNASYSADGLCLATSNAENRSISFRTDSAFGNPLLWAGTNVPGVLSRLAPNARFLIENTVPVSPTITGPFVNGVWAGQLTVLAPASNLVLRAIDPQGRSGDSTPIQVAPGDDHPHLPEPGSLPRITAIEATPAGLRITFSSLLNRRYRLERAPDLESGVWQTIAEPHSATGALTHLIDSSAPPSPQQFYRVRLLP